MTAQGGDLLAWLDAAITKREEAARRLGGKPFKVKKHDWGGVYLEGAELHEDEIAHIVLHDPESVLRRCAADRKLLELHAQDSLPNGIDLDECRTCGGANEPWPCPTLLTLAEGYGWTGGER